MQPKPWKDWVPGVLSGEQIKILAEQGYINNLSKFKDDIGYSSFDLHLTDEVYRMKKGAIKPDGAKYFHRYLNKSNIAERIQPNNNNIFILERESTYVVKLQESFPYTTELKEAEIYGRATAKSSVGRVDVLARLIVDGMYEYESFNPDNIEKSSGEMFLEVTPITFKVGIKKDIPLSQLRLFFGRPEDSEINSHLLYRSTLRTSTGEEKNDQTLTVSLKDEVISNKKVIAYKAKKVDKVVNLWGEEENLASEFWDLVEIQEEQCTFNSENRLIIEKDSFYILKSDENISLPPSIAVYCKAMDESLGEMRIHYAGFVHPFFGYKREDGMSGTPLIFEVRGHDLIINLNHREKLAKLLFYRMSEEPEKKKEEKYDTQSLTLSKFFRPFI